MVHREGKGGALAVPRTKEALQPTPGKGDALSTRPQNCQPQISTTLMRQDQKAIKRNFHDGQIL